MEHKIYFSIILKGLNIIKEIERALAVARIVRIDDYPNSKMFKIEYMVNRKRKQITRRYKDNNKTEVYQEMEKLILILHEQLINDHTFKNRRRSEYKGVSWNKRDKKWQVYIKRDGETTIMYLGSYKDEKDAGRAYNAKALEFYGEFAELNIIN